MQIDFHKYQALGNDFVLIDAIDQALSLTTAQIQHLAHRQLGVGCDQVLALHPPHNQQHDFFYQIYNADGSEVGQCGNGARAAIHYLYTQRQLQNDTIRLATHTTSMSGRYLGAQGVEINMGIPKQVTAQSLIIQEQTHHGMFVDVGNPHFVLTVQNITNAPVKTLGQQLTRHKDFADGVNVGFMQVIDPHTIQLRVYERGVGETQACGSGASAAALAGLQQQLLQSPVTVHLSGGSLLIEQTADQTLLMTGPAQRVFSASITLL